MEVDVFTIGFARRATPYKRAVLIFTDIERLKLIASNGDPFQLVFSGKARPKDYVIKELIRRIIQAIGKLKFE